MKAQRMGVRSGTAVKERKFEALLCRAALWQKAQQSSSPGKTDIPKSNVSIKARILLVDDQPLVRYNLRAFLVQRSPWEVYEAEGGKAAVGRIADIKPDVAVLDITMPEMNGLRVADEICRLAPRTKIVFMSSHYTPGEADILARLFGDGKFVQKSEIYRRLVPVINRLLPEEKQAN